MQVAGLVLGIIGSVAGIVIGGVIAVFVGMLGLMGAEDTEGALGDGLGVLLASVIAVVGTALVMTEPRAGAGLMAAGAVVGFLFMQGGFALAGVPLLLGAALTLWAMRGQAGDA